MQADYECRRVTPHCTPSHEFPPPALARPTARRYDVDALLEMLAIVAEMSREQLIRLPHFRQECAAVM